MLKNPEIRWWMKVAPCWKLRESGRKLIGHALRHDCRSVTTSTIEKRRWHVLRMLSGAIPSTWALALLQKVIKGRLQGKKTPWKTKNWMQWCRKMKRMRLTTQYAKLKEKAHDRETWHQCVTEKEPSFGQKTLDWTRDVDNWDLDSGNNFNKLWLWGKIKYCTVNNSGQCTFQ